MTTVNFDDDAIRRLGDQVAAQIQRDVNERIQLAAQRVADRYAGESVDEVHALLVSEISKAIAPLKITPNRDELSELAETIVGDQS